MNRQHSSKQPSPTSGALRAPTSRWSRWDRAQSGFTLVELLVVVTIVLMLFGLAATVIQPLREGRDVREAARMVNAYLAQAQTRAIQRGRPVGIWIRRLPLQPNISLELAMAELPPPYGGDVLNAKIGVVGAASAEYNRNTADPRFFNVGNWIRFDYKGPLRIITSTNPELHSIEFAPPVRFTGQVPFQVYGFPRSDPEDPNSPLIQAQSAVHPLTFPASVAIDVAHSGIGWSSWFSEVGPNDPADGEIDPLILFGADGSVERVIAGLNNAPEPDHQRPLSAIHLLISRPGTLRSPDLAGGNNFWVSINNTTGRITTSAFSPLTEQQIQSDLSKSDLLKLVRRFAMEGLSDSGG
jgi:prepilin-type N-terminal cleavage/methylation domain-containing protein